MISHLEEDFFAEPYVSENIKNLFFQKVDSANFLLLVLESTDLYQNAQKAYEDALQEGYSFHFFLKTFLTIGESNGQKDIKFSALNFSPATELSYLTVGMPPILVGGLNGSYKPLMEGGEINSSESFNIATYPSLNIVNLLIHNSDQFGDVAKNGLSTFFSKKEIIDYVKKTSENQDILNNLNFIFINNAINKYIKYTIHDKITSSLEAISAYEGKLSSTLESFSDNIIYNTNASLVFSEMILNAFEHGVLEISPAQKQSLIMEDKFDRYVAEQEEKTDKEIDVSISFYDDKILKVTIDDNGSGFDYKNYMEKLTNVSDDTYRGRGLIMSLNICTALFYGEAGNKVSFYIRYKDEESPEEFNLDEEAYLRSLSVLYVEDDEFIRNSLSHIIKRDVRNLYLAADGQEGLELFKKHKPPIVVTDVEMPALDGLEMTEEIKKIAPDTNVVITTGYSSEDFLMRAIDVGVDKFLVKPISISILRDTLRSLAKSIFFREVATKQQSINFKNINSELASLKAQNSYIDSLQKAALEKEKLIIRDDRDKISGLEIDLFYETVEILGGDIYGIYKIDENRTLSYIIDSSGKGISASVIPLFSAAYLNRFVDKSLKRGSYSFNEAVSAYLDYIKDFLLDEEYVKITLIEFDLEKRELTKAGFGTYPTLLLEEESREVKQIRSDNPPFVKRDGSNFKSITEKIPERFALLMFTDTLAANENSNMDEISKMFQTGSSTEEFAKILFEEEEISPEDKKDITIIKITPDS